MKKKIWKMAAVIWILAALLPIRAFAAGGDTFRLDGTGTVTLVSEHAAKEKISSLQFSLLVEGADQVDFQFSASNAKVLEARYHEDTKILNIYLAGTKALFAENTDTLEIGTVLALKEDGSSASATVSVVADSLWYVYGNEQVQALALEVPEAVSIGPNSSSGAPGGSGNGSGESGGNTGNSGSESGGSDSDGGNSGSDSGAEGGGTGWNNGNQLGTDPGAPGIGNPGGNGADASGSGAAEDGNGGRGGNSQSKGNGKNGNSQDGAKQDSDAGSEEDLPLQPDVSDAGSVSESYRKLKETLENAEKLLEEDYTPESFQVLKDMIAKAREVLEHPHVTEEELREALLNLENAIGALEKNTEAGPSQLLEESGKKGTGFLVAGIVLAVILLIGAGAFAIVTLHGRQAQTAKKGGNKNGKRKKK